MDPEFVDELPEPIRKSVQHKAAELAVFAEKLRANPGRWAKYPYPVGPNKANYASAIRRGTLKAFRPIGEFEARASGGDVYIRFVGEEPQ